MSGVETIIVVLGIMTYSIVRQIAGEPLRLKRLIGLPAALTVIGIVEVARIKGPVPTHTDLVLIGVGCAINAVIGILQGRLMQLESRNGYLWGQMPKSVLWWWAAKIASGVVLDGVGHALGAELATMSAVMLLRLGVNRLAQAAIVAPRGFATGVPFAPEPDKTGGGRKSEFVSEKNRFLTEIRDRATVLFEDVRADHPYTHQSAPGQPRRNSINENPFGYRSGPSRPPSSRPPTIPPPGLKRQLAQLLLRELNNRINDPAK
jgi:hypothetical protein